MGFKKATAAYSLVHFVVDFSCAFLIYGFLCGSSQWMMCLLAYNFFAFAMQMPMGVVSDYIGRNRLLAMLGCLLVAASFLMTQLPLVLCVAAGLGNGLFHIGAGRDVLVHSGGRYTTLGIFVSPGALGLYTGMLAGKESLLSACVPVGLLILSAGIIWLIAKKSTNSAKTAQKCEKKRITAGTLLMLLCLFLVVCLRSYVGMTLVFPWKDEADYAFWLLLALVLGKVAGGILADWLGASEAALLSLLASALLFMLYHEPACGILAVFFFNMSMPIALGAVTRLFPGNKGFGFGLLTFGLFLGFLPVLMELESCFSLPWGYCAASIVSAVLLFIGLDGVNNLPLTTLAERGH